MKVSVWTSWGAQDGRAAEPKCIFMGDIPLIPRIDDQIVVREGFCAERVVSVIHDLVDGEVEITIAGGDPDNEYGHCLVNLLKGA